MVKAMGWGNLGRRRREACRTSRSRACSRWLAALPFALLPTPGLAQSAVSTEAQVAILERGSVAKTGDMDFGQIAGTAASGTVVLTPTPTATCVTTGGLIRTGPCRAAEFAVRARRNGRIRIRETNGGTIVLAGPGGATMTLTDLTIDVSDMAYLGGGNGGGGNFGRYEITSPGDLASFRLGGTLHVAAAQAPGTYTGTVDVRVQFN